MRCQFRRGIDDDDELLLGFRGLVELLHDKLRVRARQGIFRPNLRRRLFLRFEGQIGDLRMPHLLLPAPQAIFALHRICGVGVIAQRGFRLHPYGVLEAFGDDEIAINDQRHAQTALRRRGDAETNLHETVRRHGKALCHHAIRSHHVHHHRITPVHRHDLLVSRLHRGLRAECRLTRLAINPQREPAHTTARREQHLAACLLRVRVRVAKLQRPFAVSQSRGRIDMPVHPRARQ